LRADARFPLEASSSSISRRASWRGADEPGLPRMISLVANLDLISLITVFALSLPLSADCCKS